MNPVDFKESMHTLKEEGKLSVPIWYGQYSNSEDFGMITAWKPTEKELLDLQAGKPVYLCLQSKYLQDYLPSVLLTTETPFE